MRLRSRVCCLSALSSLCFSSSAALSTLSLGFCASLGPPKLSKVPFKSAIRRPQLFIESHLPMGQLFFKDDPTKTTQSLQANRIGSSGDEAGTESAKASTKKAPRMTKVYETTIALIPPDEVWGPVQNLRLKLRDAGLYRWPPHINLLYPFIAEKYIPEVLSTLEEAGEGVEPFEVTLGEFGLFKTKGTATLWLRPDTPHDALDCLQQALQDAVPICNEQRARNSGYTGHMTVTHLTPDSFEDLQEGRDWHDRCDQLMNECQQSWNPISFTCREVHIMARRGMEGQFKLKHRIRLGGDVAAEERITHEEMRGYPLMISEMPDWVREAQDQKKRRKKSGGKFKYREKDLNAIRTSWGDKKLLLQEVLGAPQAVTFHLLCTIQTAT
mmetsp:Transcript_41731/g.65162  ORF Transcript_41731/g.65162 Transcript_41731/m.65162 type:complete len:384 (+) Transcript_41731:130-1281(+)